MKKLITVIAVVFLLTACSDASVKISKSSTTLITIGTEKITRGDLFSTFMSRYPSETVLKMATRIILDKEVPASDAAIIAAADAALKKTKDTWKEDFTNFLTSYGYETEKDYYDNELIVKAQTDALTSKYMTDNYDALVATYLPRKVRVIQAATDENAKKAIAEIKDGANFEATAAKYSSASYKGQVQLVTTKSTLFAEALSFATTRTVPGLTGSPIQDTTNTVFYVVQVTDADPSKFKEELLTSLKADTTFQELAMLSYFADGKFEVYDKTVYDEFKSNYPSYLTQK
ncbi:MAG: hypothetical protein E4G74_01870 [Erysipelotrichales bacterium]|nr:MAG: hypothetical protein E4G74_01870 [Erysipelotrichales bacterium]